MNPEFRDDLSGTEAVGIPTSFDDHPVFRRPDEPTPQRPPQLGSIGERAVAFLLDAAVWGLAYFGLWFLIAQTFDPVWLLLSIPLLGLAIFDLHRLATAGFTLGKQLVGLRVVDESSYAPIGWMRGLFRGLVLGGAVVVCFLPAVVLAVLMASDPRRQGWHDKAARSIVVRSQGPRRNESKVPHEAGFPVPPVPSSQTATSGTVVPPPAVPANAAPIVAVDLTPDAPRTPPVGSEPKSLSLEAPSKDPDPPLKVRWHLQLEDGSSRQVNSAVYVGRDPLVDAVETGATAWTIDDPKRSISKTHAVFGVTNDQLWVEDLHSTNGIAVESLGSERSLDSGGRASLLDGDVVRLGDLSVRVVGE